jgi:transcriptional regulator with XRE-family HTH domain
MTAQWEVGQRLQQARESRGLSKRSAAHLAGISEARWRHIESGIERRRGVDYPARPSALILARIARAVGEDAQDVLRQAGFDAEVDVVSVPDAEVALVDISGLDFDSRAKVLGYIDALKDIRNK